MIRLNSAVVVEGKYDKIRLSNIVDAPVFTTDGFRLFKNKEKIELLRAVAKKHGIIILTDSDSAGMFIRNRLKNYIGEEYIKNVYLPPLKGKERRKNAPSAEGLLGVEGTPDEIIVSALEKFCCERNNDGKKIEKSDFYRWGLTGENSKAKRDALKRKLALPKDLSPNALLEAVNLLFEYDEFEKELEGISEWAEQRDKK